MLLATLPKFPALLSILCSSFIIIRVLQSSTRTKIIDRIMLGLSMSDVFSSLNYFLGTWLIPKGERSVFGGPIYGASGTKATCQLSGFLTQFSIASPLYNGTLALYYLKTIYYNHQEKDLYKSEKWLHTIPLTYAFLTALIACFRALSAFSSISLTSLSTSFCIFLIFFLVSACSSPVCSAATSSNL